MERAWSFAGWYCRRGATLSGPFRPEQIRKLVESRRLRPSDRVWERWRRRRQSYLFPALASTASAEAVRLHEMTPSSRPTSVNAVTARSICSGVCAADT